MMIPNDDDDDDDDDDADDDDDDDIMVCTSLIKNLDRLLLIPGYLR